MGQTGSITVLIAVLMALAFFLRLLPHIVTRGETGVDHWFWKSYVETYRRDKVFPPMLPQYLLETNQWYPPLFPLLLARLPEKWFNSLSHLIAVIIDMIRLLLLLGVAGWLSGWDWRVLGITGVVYAVTPILVSYNIQLNPRGIGALFLDGLLVVSIWLSLSGGAIWLWGMVSLLGGLVLLTHKMSTQLFWFLCLGLGIALGDWHFLLLIPASMVSALLMSGGFYLKVLRAHWDIVTFWNRNWRWLQAHPVLESPVYAEPGYETPTKHFLSGAKGLVRHLTYLIGFNPFAWAVFGLLLIVSINVGDGQHMQQAIFIWLAFTLLFSLATVFVPILRCIGSGYYYLYNSAFPAALLWGIAVVHTDSETATLVTLFAALSVSTIAIGWFIKKTRGKDRANRDNFEAMVQYLKGMPHGVVMCLPPQLYDEIAYKTGHHVLYGGHGYGFRLLEPYFPRLLLSFTDISRRYPVLYLVTMKDYLPRNFEAELAGWKRQEFGNYLVYVRE